MSSAKKSTTRNFANHYAPLRWRGYGRSDASTTGGTWLTSSWAVSTSMEHSASNVSSTDGGSVLMIVEPDDELAAAIAGVTVVDDLAHTEWFVTLADTAGAAATRLDTEVAITDRAASVAADRRRRDGCCDDEHPFRPPPHHHGATVRPRTHRRHRDRRPRGAARTTRRCRAFVSRLLEPSHIPTETGDLGVGVVGYGPFGGMGYLHGLAATETDGLRFVAAADSASERLVAARADFPELVGHDSAQALGDNPAVDIAIIATPPVFHAELAIELLRAGKHVVIEKPMCLLPRRRRSHHRHRSRTRPNGHRAPEPTMGHRLAGAAPRRRRRRHRRRLQHRDVRRRLRTPVSSVALGGVDLRRGDLRLGLAPHRLDSPAVRVVASTRAVLDAHPCVARQHQRRPVEPVDAVVRRTRGHIPPERRVRDPTTQVPRRGHPRNDRGALPAVAHRPRGARSRACRGGLPPRRGTRRSHRGHLRPDRRASDVHGRAQRAGPSGDFIETSPITCCSTSRSPCCPNSRATWWRCSKPAIVPVTTAAN